MTIKIGPVHFQREQPPFTAEERDVVSKFHQLYYDRWRAGSDTINLAWFGHLVWKCPFDLWMYQEILVRRRVDVVLETGTHRGGSALYMAMILDQIGHGEVISVDIKAHQQRPLHPRISYVTGSSVDPEIVDDIKRRVAGKRAMVILDSNHQADHVYGEMMAYSPLVQLEDYLIVEDTNVNGHPVFPDFGPGPMEAVERFLSETNAFDIDFRCERFMMTLNPRGYLKRVH